MCCVFCSGAERVSPELTRRTLFPEEATHLDCVFWRRAYATYRLGFHGLTSPEYYLA